MGKTIVNCAFYLFFVILSIDECFKDYDNCFEEYEDWDRLVRTL